MVVAIVLFGWLSEEMLCKIAQKKCVDELRLTALNPIYGMLTRPRIL